MQQHPVIAAKTKT